MTFRHKNGKTLNQLYRAAQRRAEWLGILHRNVEPKLNRLAAIVGLKDTSLQPRAQNRIDLVYTGTDLDKDMPRIQRILGATFTGLVATVQFSRITATVTLTVPVAKEAPQAEAA